MLAIVFVPAALSSAAQETPLWRLALENIPFDPSAIVLYAILGGSIWLIWWGHRHSGAGRPRSNDPRPTERPETGEEEDVGEPDRSKPRDRGRGRAA